MANPLEKLLRAGEGRILRRLQQVVKAVNALEEDYAQLTDEELRASVGAAAPGAVSRCAVDDGILTDHGRLVLLASDRLVVLEGLGPSVWLLLDEPRTAADVVACLRTEGPVPEDAEARVREAMDALVSAGLATAG